MNRVYNNKPASFHEDLSTRCEYEINAKPTEVKAEIPDVVPEPSLQGQPATKLVAG